MSGEIKVHNGSSFNWKPIKVWNGSAWVVKPLKFWNGSAWKLTNEGGGTVSITDSFNRTDSATLGTADTGETWTSSAGSSGVFGISSNKAYVSSPQANSVAVLDTGITNYSVGATFTGTTGEWGLVLRYVDSNNYLLVSFASQYWHRIRTRIASTNTAVVEKGFTTISDGTLVRVDVVGNAVTVYMNGIETLTYDLAGALSTGTKVGIFSSSSTSNRWDDFYVTEL